MKFLFIAGGAGEYAILKPLVNYVQEQGDSAMFLVSGHIAEIVKSEYKDDMDIEIFTPEDAEMRIHSICEFYKVDVLVMKPSRGWMMRFKRPDSIKYAVTVEDNLNFRGLGGSYKLDKVYPEWIDIYAVNWHPEVFKKALDAHYGIDSLEVYEDLQKKVKPIGWLGTKIEKNAEEPYSFAYFGSRNTGNPGWLQVFVDAFFKVNLNKKLIAVSDDIVIGNYPNLEVVPMVNKFDELVASADEVFVHEGWGTISKAIVNEVPVMSLASKNRIKQVEIKPASDLGIIYKVDRATSPFDMEELDKEIEKFRAERGSLAKAMKKYSMDGCENLYKLLK